MSATTVDPQYAAPHTLEVQKSTLDASVNFIRKGAFDGAIEARYVRRSDDYFIVYLSSQTGCAKACRFCHLTQSGQTKGIDLPVSDYLRQADEVLGHYDEECEEGKIPAQSVNFNFMSRGEVFANRHILDGASSLLDGLADRSIERELIPRFKFSTIMPTEIRDHDLEWIFPRHNPDLYYSLYSMDPAFRRRWLPKALDANIALDKLTQYQQFTRKVVVLHWALIEGANDDEKTMSDIAQAVNARGLRCDFNLVRYNPFSPGQGREPAPEVMERCADTLLDAVPGCRVQIVGRVGHDVKASCGMFVPGTGTRDKKAQAIRELPVLSSSASRVLRA